MKRTWSVWLKGLAAAFISGGSSSLATGIGAMSLAPETFNMNGGLMMTVKLMAICAAFNAVLGAAMYLKQSPVPPDEVPSHPAATGLIVVLLMVLPSLASASEARLVVDCAEEVEVLNGKTNEIEKECKRERIYFDMGIRFGGVAFKLNRPREILAGFDAGTGYGIRFRPDWWSFTPSFFSIDLFANAGYLAREGIDDAITVGALLVLSLFDWIGLGGGVSHAFGLGDSYVETTWIGTAGLSKSI